MTTEQEYCAAFRAASAIRSIVDSLEAKLRPSAPNLTVVDVQSNFVGLASDTPLETGVVMDTEYISNASLDTITGRVWSSAESPSAMLPGGWGTIQFRGRHVRLIQDDTNDAQHEIRSAWSEWATANEPQNP